MSGAGEHALRQEAACRGCGRPYAPPADEEIAAAYASPMSLRAVAARFRIGRESAREALGRAGVPLRTRAQSAGIRRAREAAGRGEYPWAAEAARRHQAGEAVGKLAREYRAGPPTVQAAIERQGVTVTIRRYGRQDAAGDAPPGGAT